MAILIFACIKANSNMTSFFLVYFDGKDGNLYLHLQAMSHTIYAAKFEQTIIHQHVHLRRKSQSFTGACANEIIPSINRSFVYKTKEGRYVRISTDFSVVNVHVDELSSAQIWQHKLCATFSANVNINYCLPIKVYYRICTLKTYQNRNNHR
jgi:hypothetical protein